MDEAFPPPEVRTLGEAFMAGVRRAREKARVVSEGVDRHGSYQWIADWTAGHLRRSVGLDVTASGAGWAFEAWAGAESNERYTRRLVGTGTTAPGVAIVSPDQLTLRAVDYAEALASVDLDQRYELSERYGSSAVKSDRDPLPDS